MEDSGDVLRYSLRRAEFGENTSVNMSYGNSAETGLYVSYLRCMISFSLEEMDVPSCE